MSGRYLGICCAKQKGLSLGQEGEKPTNDSIVGTQFILVRDMLWEPTKPKIQDWVDFKALEFPQEERKDPGGTQ